MLGIMWGHDYIVMNETHSSSALMELIANRQIMSEKMSLKETNRVLWLKIMWLEEPLWVGNI